MRQMPDKIKEEQEKLIKKAEAILVKIKFSAGKPEEERYPRIKSEVSLSGTPFLGLP